MTLQVCNYDFEKWGFELGAFIPMRGRFMSSFKNLDLSE